MIEGTELRQADLKCYQPFLLPLRHGFQGLEVPGLKPRRTNPAVNQVMYSIDSGESRQTTKSFVTMNIVPSFGRLDSGESKATYN